VTVTDKELIARQFEEQRARLGAVAYRMLGSPSDAEDAVQETWLRLSRSDFAAIDSLSGWLTTVVARVALDMLRARESRREQYAGTWLPEPVVTLPTGDANPEDEALIADSVRLALLVVLDTLSPKERLAFVLHDMFGLSFQEIAPIVNRSPEAARKLASRARRRVQGAPTTQGDLPRQRAVVDAFLAAAREGDFDGLLAVLDPDVVFHVDAGGRPVGAIGPVVGAEAVARSALANAGRFLRFARPAIVNGGAGLIIDTGHTTIGVVGLTVSGDRVAEIDLITDPAKLRHVGRSDDL
jgi:RNA polymerase sigma factor (sigma-70 family)